MAKPSTVPTWATDTNFSSGPASGSPTKVNPAGAPNVVQGSVPGEGAAAEFLNWLFNILCDWIGWVADGSSAGASDAHLVETDATGETVVRGITATSASGESVTVRGSDGITYRQGDVPDADTNIDGASEDTWLCATPTAARSHHLLEASATTALVAGQRTVIYRKDTGGFDLTIYRESVATPMVTLTASNHCSAVFEVRGATPRWHLLVAGVNATPGGDA